SALPAVADTFTTKAADGITVHGERYFGDLAEDAPLVLLFHQAGSNGRGEYGPLAAWLNEQGVRALAFDQRVGGDTYGESNRTVSGLPEGADPGYCDAYPDLEAGLAFAVSEGLADRAFVWGSSYSASLVFRLAADHPEHVAGVIACSPASGGPMVDCRARNFVESVTCPVLVLRPASEMERESSVAQRGILEAAGATFLVADQGVHGSSMLVDERTEADMSVTRAAVGNWLREHADTK
ncbi:MAG: hypothetical protein HKN12_11655, partial [Gemmatimonadetes bacterium]|nr:hypothetical protein [Gemmatimonadota bacterium]